VSITATITITIIVLLLSGFFNFYGNRPWILYFPLLGLLLCAGYIGWGVLAFRIASTSSISWGVGLVAAGYFGRRYIQMLERREAEKSRRVADPLFAAQLLELRELQDFLGGKDEGELWELFDFPGMTRFNIARAKEVMNPSGLTLAEAAEINGFFQRGKSTVDAKYCTIARTAGGVRVEPLPGKLHILNLSNKHVSNRQVLAKFEGSLHLPLAVRNALSEFDKAVVENTHILLDTINAKLVENAENIVQEENGNSPLFGATSGAFIDRCIRLKPKQEKIISEIRRYLKTGEYAD
jgi:hypothetical protein